MTAFITSCGSMRNVIPVSDLRTMAVSNQINPQKMFELGSVRYASMEFEEALYYYTNIIAIYTNDLESQAWAYYETGYVYNEMGKKELAVRYMEMVAGINSRNKAPQILASQVLERIRPKKQ